MLRCNIAPAEASGLADESVDLVSVAQALDWFNLGLELTRKILTGSKSIAEISLSTFLHLNERKTKKP